MAGELHISISAEKLFSVGDFVVTNSIFTSLIISALILIFSLLVRLDLTSQKRPSKLQNFAEWLVESFYSLVYGVTNDHPKARRFTPLFMSFFLFILLNNWFGLIPGVGSIGFIEKPEAEHEAVQEVEETDVSSSVIDPVFAVEEHAAVETTHETAAEEESHQDETMEAAQTEHRVEQALETEGVIHEEDVAHEVFVPYFRPGTADLNTTLALALFSVVATQIIGIKYQRFGYFKKYINFSSPIMFFVGILEIISEFAKIISFAFRLFGNIFAGEVLLVVVGSIIPLIVPMPFYGLELFVGFIQAFVFALLSLVFFNMATVGHDEH